MGRWEPDASGRLKQAALELYGERGYDETTVAEIAERAGLTERTFFRYFADKREVLFGGSAELQKIIVDAIAAAPKATTPLDTVALALEATAPYFEDRRVWARKRQAVIASHPELREREVMKHTAYATAAAQALRERGVGDPAASLMGEAGIAIFKVALELWANDGKQRSLSHHIRASVRELKATLGAPPGARLAASQRRR
jgi:AcrR family transcriptional regulator